MNNAKIKFENKTIYGVWRDVADESVWNEIFKYREYRACDDAIRGANFIFDIGAHAGFFSLYACALNPDAKIICVEPDLANIEAMRENFKLNNAQTNINIINSALVPKEGEYFLEMSKDSHNHKVISAKENELKKANRSVRGLTLGSLKLDNGVSEIDLMKIDIEGGERKLFDAWGSEEWGSVKNLIFEYHEGDGMRSRLEGIVRKNGFSASVFPSQFDRSMGIIFAKNKKI